MPGLRPAAGARRQERPLARLAAEAAHRHRPAPDQRAGRHHQLHHLRPRPAAARVRRRQGARQSHRAPRQERRDAARARRQDLHARRRHVRDRRRAGRRVARRHHGRRGDRLLGDDHRRADRIGAVGRAQHRADRAQARHQFRRALSLRARRRSGLHAARAWSWRRRWCSTSAAASRPRSWWPAIRRRRRRSSTSRSSELPRLAGLKLPIERRAPRAGEARLLRRRPGRARQGRGAVVAAGRARPRRYRRGSRAHRRRRPRAVDAVSARRLGAQAGAHADPEAHPQGQARARRARADRGGDLVVRVASARRNCSAAAARRWRSPIRSPRSFPTCGRASFPAW